MCLNVLRKKLLIRSWRRGTKELDLILGKFSDKNISGFDLSELNLYEKFLSNEDYLIYDWIFEKEPYPKLFQNIIEKIQDDVLS